MDFTQTTTGLARAAAVSPETVRRYADMGLIEFRVASNGTRLFMPSQADQVRQLCAERLSNRGRRSAE